MRAIETRIKELTVISEKLKVEHRREYEMIQEIIKRLTERWEELQRLSEKRQQALESAQEIQKFHRWVDISEKLFPFLVNSIQLAVLTSCLRLLLRDADDTKAWISEKDTALSSADYGRDLASVQALQRKHDVLERDLAALEEKVRL